MIKAVRTFLRRLQRVLVSYFQCNYSGILVD